VCLFAGKDLLGIYQIEGSMFRLITMLYVPSAPFD